MICETCGNICDDKDDHDCCDLCDILEGNVRFTEEDKELLRKADVNQFLEYIESFNYYDDDIENLLRELVEILKRNLVAKSSLTEGGLS